MTKKPEDYLVRAAARPAAFEDSHPLNPASLIFMTPLSRIVGLQRIGISLGRVPPGKESFVYHSHRREEEFLYILSGRGIAEIDDEELEVGAGDFLGFPTPSIAHHLRNPFAEDLVYLMGGEHKEVEVADFPRLGKRFIRDGDEVSVVDVDALKPMLPR
jgi:uncharacterized cupin superfamily protein